jgi:titin
MPLTWTAPTPNGGYPITDYLVQYKTSNSNTYLTFADGVSTDLTTTVTGLITGTVYNFRVAAINATGTGEYSNIVTATTA